MKRPLLAGLALAAFAVGPVIAADMPVKAPILAPAPVYNWTGCYLGGGGGYGMWNQDNYLETDPAPHTQLTITQTNAGRGWFGTVGGGCDYQVNSNIVVGAFADGDWGSLSGNYSTGGGLGAATLVAAGAGTLAGGSSIAGGGLQGSETMQSAWYVGARMGWLVTPTVMTYWDGGYTQARFAQVNLSSPSLNFNTPGSIALGSVGIASLGLNIPAQTYNGWFLGGGLDYALPFFSGLFWQTEYRFATYNAVDIPIIVTATGLSSGRAINSQMFVQTVRSELIFRFNWMH